MIFFRGQVPEESPFVIDAVGGEIRTRTPLDFERQPVHYVVVTARDGGREPRIATATVTVLVQDTADEPPIFLKDVYNAIVPENVEDYLVTTVVVSSTTISLLVFRMYVHTVRDPKNAVETSEVEINALYKVCNGPTGGGQGHRLQHHIQTDTGRPGQVHG